MDRGPDASAGAAREPGPREPWRDDRFRDELRAHLLGWSTPDDRRGALELGLTVVAYAAALALAAGCLRHALDASGLVARVAWGAATLASTGALSLIQVRTFLVHHDLCHGSLFTSRRLNAVLAPLLGTLASTSSSVWHREHSRHHRDSNNLDCPQDGQTAPWTVETFLGAKPWQRGVYRFINQRPVLFGLVPPLYFLGFMHLAARWYENVLFAGLLGVLFVTGTLPAFALAFVPATLFGFLLFHAQHTGPSLVRRRTAAWDFIENGLRGSTLLTTPRVPGFSWFLQWCLYGVEFHHVHHLHPGLPAWRQRACHQSGARFFVDVPRVTLGDAVRATRLTLYDEAAGRLVGFDALPDAPSHDSA